ncbi:hypothetical protein LOAG_09809 [Loa loa]|uniref:Uncharacterized protein n=1 Tax=Loa loa TaxID=7209 RepID=A0A1S0TR50_LOALO|nr:hypothetical protein LOAG_09809 [Loa loa]EFO18690.1 hypothetical protein LOAG_09809 [Loa loa]
MKFYAYNLSQPGVLFSKRFHTCVTYTHITNMHATCMPPTTYLTLSHVHVLTHVIYANDTHTLRTRASHGCHPYARRTNVTNTCTSLTDITYTSSARTSHTKIKIHHQRVYHIYTSSTHFSRMRESETRTSHYVLSIHVTYRYITCPYVTYTSRTLSRIPIRETPTIQIYNQIIFLL